MIKKDELYKIYVLKCPTTLTVRYVGFTRNSLKNRLNEHCMPSKLIPKTHKNNWIKSLNARPIIELVEGGISSLDDACKKEIEYISKYKSIGCNLTNSTDGGEGHLNHSHSKEAIDKILRTKKRNGTNNHSKQTIENIRKSKIGLVPTENQLRNLKEWSDEKKKAILQFDISGHFIRSWTGIREASRELNISHCGILRSLNNTNRVYKGFIWSYQRFSPEASH